MAPLEPIDLLLTPHRPDPVRIAYTQSYVAARGRAPWAAGPSSREPGRKGPEAPRRSPSRPRPSTALTSPVKQGWALRQNAEKLKIPLNAPAGGLVVASVQGEKAAFMRQLCPKVRRFGGADS